MNANKHGIRSNLAQVDAHVITPEEYEETTETNLSRAEFSINGVMQPHPRQQNHSLPSRGSRHPEPFPRSAVLLSGRRQGWLARADGRSGSGLPHTDQHRHTCALA
jgi:hypothetical protein